MLGFVVVWVFLLISGVCVILGLRLLWALRWVWFFLLFYDFVAVGCFAFCQFLGVFGFAWWVVLCGASGFPVCSRFLVGLLLLRFGYWVLWFLNFGLVFVVGCVVCEFCSTDIYLLGFDGDCGFVCYAVVFVICVGVLFEDFGLDLGLLILLFLGRWLGYYFVFGLLLVSF